MFSFRKCNEKGWRSTLSTFPRLEKSKTIAFVRDRHLSWPSITYSFRDTAVFAKRVCQIEIHKTNSLSVLYHRKRAFKQLCESLLPSKFQYKIKEVKIQNIGGSQISCIFWVKYMHERGRKRVEIFCHRFKERHWKRLGKRKCRLDSAAFETIDQRKMAMKRRSGQGGQKGEERQHGKGTNCGVHFTYKLSVRIRYEHNHAISTTDAWNLLVFKLKKKIKLKK